MKAWVVLGVVFLVIGVLLLGGGSGSSFDESALEAATAGRDGATLEWVNYSSEVEKLEEELDDVSTRLEIEEWAMGSKTAKAQQLRQEKSRIQAALELAKFNREDASATMDHYSSIVEELEAEKEAAGSGGDTSVFGVLCLVAALCSLCVGITKWMKTDATE